MTDRKAPEDFVPLPRNAKNRVDKPLIRALYLKSKCVEWLPFCQENGWNPQLARLWCPAQKWVEEKRSLVEQQIAADLREFQVSHRQSWIKDVRTTLENYPRAVDNVMFLVQKWMAVEMKKVTENPDSQTKPSSLFAVSETIKKCIDAKKAILLISDAVVAVTSPDPEAEVEGEAGKWEMEIRGMKKPSVKEVSELMSRYVDRPLVVPGMAEDPALDAKEPDDAEA